MLKMNSDLHAILTSVYELTLVGKAAKTDVIKKDSQLGDAARPLIKEAQSSGFITPASGVRGAWALTKSGLAYVDDSQEVEVVFKAVAGSDVVAVDKPTSRNLVNPNADTGPAENLVRELGFGRIKVQKAGVVVTYRGKRGKLRFVQVDGDWQMIVIPSKPELLQELHEDFDSQLTLADDCLYSNFWRAFLSDNDLEPQDLKGMV
ncbi:hypothetical protein [Vibrio phage YC]|uniref:Uncharacterized protein n=1 Tax=Vibrio phage YC TaxID=2267403 RepID=A0A384ZS51_9CAUD|nr:hypothetical protein HWB64_gp123 [Vibrio phage YC]AXC34492.1 hypothetical protein [Vibrio phage YC]